jgi:hypothetical protein
MPLERTSENCLRDWKGLLAYPAGRTWRRKWAPSFDRECLAPLSVPVSEIFLLRMVLGGMWEISARHAHA